MSTMAGPCFVRACVCVCVCVSVCVCVCLCGCGCGCVWVPHFSACSLQCSSASPSNLFFSFFHFLPIVKDGLPGPPRPNRNAPITKLPRRCHDFPASPPLNPLGFPSKPRFKPSALLDLLLFAHPHMLSPVCCVSVMCFARRPNGAVSLCGHVAPSTSFRLRRGPTS